MAREKQKHVFTMTVAVLLGIVLVLYMFCFTVRETQVAVLTLFGRPASPFVKPGLYFKLPWPIHNVYRFDARVQVFEDVYEETITKDKRTLVLTAAVGWRIDPNRVITFLNSTQRLDRCQELLEPIVRDAKTKVVGQYDFRNFASIRPGDLKHEDIELRIKKLVNTGQDEPEEGSRGEAAGEKTATRLKGVQEELGVEVVMVKLKRVDLSQDVASKVFERMINERKREADKYRAEGMAISEEIKARADAAREAILAMADREARDIMGKGDAEAAESYKVLNKYPKLSMFLLQIEALPKVADKLTVIFSADVPPFNLLREGAPKVDVGPPAGQAKDAQ